LSDIDTSNNDKIQQYSDILDNPSSSQQQQNKKVQNNNNNQVKTNLTKRQVPQNKAEIDIGGIIATNWSFGKKAFSNDDYVFKTLQVNIPDPETNETLPGYTIGQYVIKPKKRSMWLQYNKDALYYVDYGDAWFLIGKAGSAVETGYWLCVPEHTEHIILNSSPVSELRINLVFPGAIVVK
jgi:mannose-6-phosphate isomerase-like protein (cupin superfamily)